MAGIIASAASKTMSAGDTSADKVATGYIAGERVSLSVAPAGTTYAWSSAAPSISSVARSALSADTGAAITFTPDVAGTYVIGCIVDGVTTYVIRLTVQAAAVAEPVEAVRYSPRSDATIPAPAAGLTMYYSSDQSALVVKAPNGSISTVNLTAVP
jgi:hypothetical protein